MSNERSVEEPSPRHETLRGREAILLRHPWLTFLLPFIVYMFAGSLEPGPIAAEAKSSWLAIPYAYYPAVYMLRISLTLAAILFVWPGYKRFPFRVSPLAIVVGVVGIFVWVGLCQLQLERQILAPLGLGKFVDAGVRTGYNPFEQMTADDRAWAWLFLAVRFFGLVLVVPLVEEFVLRGFLMRVFASDDWTNLPVGTLTGPALAVAIVYPVVSHPAEALAALAWFSLVTWLVFRTKNIWDGVVAHAITNLLLGLYVVYTGHWHLM